LLNDGPYYFSEQILLKQIEEEEEIKKFKSRRQLEMDYLLNVIEMTLSECQSVRGSFKALQQNNSKTERNKFYLNNPGKSL